MRSKNILYAMMFASLCLATTGCDKELPLSAPSEGNEQGYRVALLTRNHPNDLSFNEKADHEDKVVSLQVVSDEQVTTKRYYNSNDMQGLHSSSQPNIEGTNFITFTNFKPIELSNGGTKKPNAYYLANLPYYSNFSSSENSNYFVESNAMALPTLGYCHTPIVMVAKTPELSYNWNARTVSSNNKVLENIVLTRVLAGIDVTFSANNNLEAEQGAKIIKITVDKVELMNVPDKIALNENGKLNDEIIESEDPFKPNTEAVSYYANPKHYLGKNVEDFKDNYGSDIYVPNFVEPLGQALKTESDGTYSIEYGKGLEIYNNGTGNSVNIPRRYVPANYTSSLPSEVKKITKLHFTLTSIIEVTLGEGKTTNYIHTKSIDVELDDKTERDILPNHLYKKNIILTAWKDDLSFKVETEIYPWTYVKYTEDFDLDY